MELLRFTDSAGREWEVWEVGARPPLADRPAPPSDGARPTARWLCFASGTERRRLTRYPERWYAMSARQLEGLCAQASPARAVPYIPRSADRRDR
jgi:hypothetical protein